MGKPMVSSESSEESEEESEEDHSKPFRGARPASSDPDSLFSEEDDHSDGSSSFIVEDDSQAAPTQLPSEFSMRSHDDLSHQFKVIFQFFVHIAVRPTVNRHTFMEDQLKSMALLRHVLLHCLASSRSGILFFPSKGHSQKIIGTSGLISSFLRMAAEI